MTDELKQGVKTSLGWVELANYDADPTDTSTARGGLCIVSGAPKYWTGAAWTAFTGGGGGVTGWNSLYDTGVTMAVDGLGLAWTITTNVDAFTLNKTATGAGDAINIQNAGSGYDIAGTDDEWSIASGSNVGVLELGTNGTINVTGGNLKLSVAGSTTTVEGILVVDGISTLTGAVTATASVTITGSADTDVLTITNGDVAMSNGLLQITSDDEATGSIVIVSSATTGNVIGATADDLTSGNLLYLDTSLASFTGNYIHCYDGGADDFVVGPDGGTTITTTVNSTKGLVVTGVQTSENLVVFDNTGGVIASGYAVLLLDAGGAVASGGNILRVEMNGTAAAGAILAEIVPDAGSLGLKISGGGIATREALYIDADPTANDVAFIHSDAVIAADKGLLQLTSAGAIAAGGTMMRFDVTGTPDADARMLEFDMAAVTDTNEPYAIFIDAGGKKVRALNIDADPVTNDVAYIHSDAVIAADKALMNLNSAGAIASGGNVLRVDVTGAPASGAVYVEFDFAGLTDTHENTGLLIDAGGKKVQALSIDADPVASDVVYIHSDAVIADNKAVLALHSAGAIASGSNVFRITTAGTPDAGSIIMEMDVQDDAQALLIDSDSATNHAVEIKGSGVLADGKAMLFVTSDGTALKAGSSLVRIEDSSFTSAGATVYGLEIDIDGTNMEALLITAGTAKFAESITIDTGGLTVTLGGADITGTVGLDGAVTINEAGADVNMRVEGSAEANLIFVDGGNDNVTIGATSSDAYYDFMVSGSGILALKEGTTPTATASHGKIYTKSDNKFYAQSGDGVEHELAYA